MINKIIQEHSLNIKFSSVISAIVMLYLFVAVNDIVLLPFGLLWIKNTLFFLMFFGVSMSCGVKSRQYLAYMFIVGFLFIYSFAVSIFYDNDLDYIFQENLSLLIALVVPLLVLSWVGVDHEKIKKISQVFLWAIVFATFHKVLFVIYMDGYLAISFLDYLFQDLLGRGKIGDIERLNTGNQLLVSLALFIAYRYFAVGYQRGFMCVVFSSCIINIYLASSRFFTPVTFILMGLIVLFDKKAKFMNKFIYAGIFFLLSFYLGYDLLSSREMSNEVFDIGYEYRINQSAFLFKSFVDAPLFGKGPGFSINDIDYVLAYAFENQVLALFAKYGLIGSFIFTCLVAMQFNMFKFSKSKKEYMLFVLFIILASMFNPYLFGTYAAWAFSFILIISYLFDEKNRQMISVSPKFRDA